MCIRLPNFTRQHLITATMMAMVINLFTARGLLSLSMILFIAVTSVQPGFKNQVFAFFKNPVFVSIAILFFIPFLSGAWSTHLTKWSEVVQIKIPLLVLPFAFAGPWQLSAGQWRWVWTVFLLCVLSGTIWSALQYFQNMEAISRSYLKAKVIPTPLENDHIRFSWLVSTTAIVNWYIASITKSKKIQLLLVIVTLWLVAYLHILSVRTGLACLYIAAFIFIIQNVFKSSGRQRFLYIVPIAAIPVLAWFLLPTFHNRIRYFLYDFSYVKSNTYLQGANDGNRVLSLKAGLDIITHHPFGVGAGDVESQTLNWYAGHVPDMLFTDKLLLPSSEWLIYGAAAGWLGMILFTGSMMVPVFIKDIAARRLWLCITIAAAFSLAFDIGLEVQFGVFLYAFIILSCYKWLSNKSVAGNE